MALAWVAITDCITSLPSALSTATEMVLWWTSRPIYLMLSIGCSFRQALVYCSAQQPNPTSKGAPFYNAWPRHPSSGVPHPNSDALPGHVPPLQLLKVLKHLPQ